MLPAPEGAGRLGPTPGGASRDWWGGPRGPLRALRPPPPQGSAPQPASPRTSCTQPQDARDPELPPGPPAMEEEAAGVPHGQPDLPAPAAAPDRGRHPTRHGEREAGSRAGFHVSEPAHRQGEPPPRPPPLGARPLAPSLGTHAAGASTAKPRPTGPSGPSAVLEAPALVQTDLDPCAVSRAGRVASLRLSFLILKVG